METLKAVNAVSMKNEEAGITYNYEHKADTAPDRINFHRQKKVEDKEVLDITGGFDTNTKVLHLCFHTGVSTPDKSIVDVANNDINEILTQFNQ